MTPPAAITTGDYLAICGGVGGAKLALGLSRVLAPQQLSIVVNTGDDFEHSGLLICPDVDTVTYTLADVVHPQQGWGRAGESWHALEEVERLGGETWFRLGDKDIGLHLTRRSLLDKGMRLAAVTHQLARCFGIGQSIIPMSDDPVRTEVETDEGWLSFQNYFVARRCDPVIRAVRYRGIEAAAPAAEFLSALRSPSLRGVFICPSNPYLSIDPILRLRGVRQALCSSAAPVIAVSPIVGGRAIKGPTAKIMGELGVEMSPGSVVEHYGEILDGFVLDRCDSDLEGTLNRALSVRVCNTVMNGLEDKQALARECLALVESMVRR